jgi:hypothetical protein
MNLVDGSGQVGTDGNALDCGCRADNGQRGGPSLLLSNDRRDRSRGWLKACTLGNCGFNLLEFRKSQAADKGGQYDQRQNHSLRHTLSKIRKQNKSEPSWEDGQMQNTVVLNRFRELEKGFRVRGALLALAADLGPSGQSFAVPGP